MIDATCKAEHWHRALPWWEMGLASCVRWYDKRFGYGPYSDRLVTDTRHRCRYEWLVRDGDPLTTVPAGTRSANKGKRRE